MIHVIKPGMLSTLQDNGRFGFQRFGIGPGGAMDEVAHRLACALVGNDIGSATLECTLTGPSLEFDQPVLLAICGADLSPTVGARPVPQGRPVLLRAGVRLDFGQRRTGARAYLAIRGGFDCAPVMHSQSTNLRGNFGGFHGRALQKGDLLGGGVADAHDFYPQLAALLDRASADTDFVAPKWTVPQSANTASTQVIRLLEGRHWDAFSFSAQQALETREFVISGLSDRMGYRLEGGGPGLEAAAETISEAVVAGTVQMPPDGNPIILMADHGTTGGYPKIAQVAAVDLPLLAQMSAHEKIHFEKISFGQAQQLYLRREDDMVAIVRAIEQRRRQPFPL